MCPRNFNFAKLKFRINDKARNIEGINFGAFKSGELNDTHAAATWNFVTQLCVCLKTDEKQEHPVSRWQVVERLDAC